MLACSGMAKTDHPYNKLRGILAKPNKKFPFAPDSET
jgi:hypothetical protein